MSLDRFKLAQQSRLSGFDVALAEIEAGRKTSHWIWYIFPQIAGLGMSTMARQYGIANLSEAVDYLRDPLLRQRLVTITGATARKIGEGVSLTRLMGSEIDALKLVSSLTLFGFAARELDPTGAIPELTTFARDCGLILATAERQGIPRCAFTTRRCEHGE